jgi:O-antigen/teichoic acid export membrane protein
VSETMIAPRPMAQVWQGALARGIASMLAKGSAFAVTILLVRRFPPADAGAFFLALAAAATMGPLLSFGMAESIARIVPSLDAQERHTESGDVVRSSIRVAGAIGGVAGAVGTIVALLLVPTFVGWLASVGCLAILLAVEAIGCAFLRSRRRVVLAETVQAIAPVVFLAVLVLVGRGEGPTAGRLFLIRSGLELAAVAVVLGLVLRMTRSSRAGRPGRSLLHASFPFWVCGLVWLALGNADVLILGLARGPEAVADYVPILRTADLTAFVQGLFAVYVLPTAAGLFASGRGDEVEGVYLHASALAFTLSAPLLAALVLAPDTIVELLVGSSSATGRTVARILAVAYGLNAVLCLSGVVVQAVGDVWELARRWAVVLGLTLVADALLVPAFGAVGAALGTLTSFVLLNAASALQLYRRHRISPFHPRLMTPVAVSAVAILTLLAVAPARGGIVWLLIIAAVMATATGVASRIAGARRAAGAGHTSRTSARS